MVRVEDMDILSEKGYGIVVHGVERFDGERLGSEHSDTVLALGIFMAFRFGLQRADTQGAACTIF